MKGFCVYSIFFYYPFWIKVRQSFFYLFIRISSMLNRPKSSISWNYLNRYLQHFAILWHWSTIATVVQCLFIESFAAKIVIVSLFIITTICLLQRHNISAHLFFEETRLSLFMLLLGITASSGKKMSVAFAVKSSVESSERNCWRSARFSGRIKSSKIFSAKAK